MHIQKPKGVTNLEFLRQGQDGLVDITFYLAKTSANMQKSQSLRTPYIRFRTLQPGKQKFQVDAHRKNKLEVTNVSKILCVPNQHRKHSLAEELVELNFSTSALGNDKLFSISELIIRYEKLKISRILKCTSNHCNPNNM